MAKSLKVVGGLGDAQPSDVLIGKSFTSENGIKVAGTSTLATDYEEAQETITDLENQIENLDNELSKVEKYTPLTIRRSTPSLPVGSNDRSLVNISGSSGSLYAIAINSGESVLANTIYLKITFDDTFTFYLDSSWWTETANHSMTGILCPVSCLRRNRGGFYGDNGGYPAYFITEALLPTNEENLYTLYMEEKQVFMPNEATSTPRSCILPPVPLKFDNHLQITGFHSGVSKAANVKVWYFLD